MPKGHSIASKFDLNGANVAEITSVSLSIDGQVADVTTLADTYKTYVRGQVDYTISVEGVYDDPNTGTVIMRAAEGTAVPWLYAPQGTGAGKVRFRGTAFVTSHEIPSSMDSAVTYSFTLQGSGTILPGTA
jgi:predicted secreted protein